MKILILTSCTGEKLQDHPNKLILEDFQQGKEHIQKRESDLADSIAPAEKMYTGQQHVRLMKGIESLRIEVPEHTVDLWILSAGYGLISGSRPIAPYECTFIGMGVRKLRSWADTLSVPEDVRKLLSQTYDLGLILLGDLYLKACAFDEGVKLGGPTLLFCAANGATRLPNLHNLRKIILSNKETKRFSCGLVGLKGEVARRVLGLVRSSSAQPRNLINKDVDILDMLDHDHGKVVQTRRAETNPSVDFVIDIPRSWWEKAHRSQFRYFIPEWDDLVDPGYDFINDEHSGGRGDWSNEVYAHQMYSEPNYDGLLMSRAVAEKSKKKKERINTLGVHRFLRVPREFPIMGDCGAFDYIMEEMPPYTTEDVIDYYTRLDFDYGVSVDHLIVTATDEQKKFRYELTINNAEDFLKAHREAGLKWEPIGAVQGWDPKSYADAAARYVKMGYRYIGLGGLVRTTTSNILLILEKVKERVPSGVGIHLFGLARLRAILRMVDLGVTSVDSASALRRAWLGGKDNYWSESGNHYRAIRIPQAGKSFRAKRMVSEGRASEDFVAKVERECIKVLRDYDRGELGLDDVLETIVKYDHLITPDRPELLDEYRRTLEARPWNDCGCDICRRDGIDVVIFRGNNRNRRRGFHNTFVFYRLLQRILETGDSSFLFPDEDSSKNPKQMRLFST